MKNGEDLIKSMKLQNPSNVIDPENVILQQERWMVKFCSFQNEFVTKYWLKMYFPSQGLVLLVLYCSTVQCKQETGMDIIFILNIIYNKNLKYRDVYRIYWGRVFPPSHPLSTPLNTLIVIFSKIFSRVLSKNDPLNLCLQSHFPIQNSLNQINQELRTKKNEFY